MVELPIVAFGQSWCEAKYSSEERREKGKGNEVVGLIIWAR